MRRGNPWRRMEDLFHPAVLFHINLHLLHFFTINFPFTIYFFSAFRLQAIMLHKLYPTITDFPFLFNWDSNYFIYFQQHTASRCKRKYLKFKFFNYYLFCFLQFEFQFYTVYLFPTDCKKKFRPNRTEFDGKLVEMIKIFSSKSKAFSALFPGEKTQERSCVIRGWKSSKEMLSVRRRWIELVWPDYVFPFSRKLNPTWLYDNEKRRKARLT